MASRQTLQCWWDGLHVADIRSPRQSDLRCRYTPEVLERWAIGTFLLSCSLPVTSRPAKATNFFRGLLPEGRQLEAAARWAGVTTNDYHRLLARYGRDIAGALVIVAEGEDPSPGSGSVVEYSAEGLEQEIGTLAENPLGLHADSELSIAGVQDKLLLVEIAEGRWGRPVHGYPSTHILKIDDGRFPGLVQAEGECLALAHAIGLADAPPRLESHGGVECLIVKRYDRRVEGGEVLRVHQEDACQALDINIEADRRRGKYESSGGPTLRQIASLLTNNALDPRAERDKLVRLVTYTMAIGNADLHGKNVSLLHDQEGNVSLAPAYDTVPTMMWPTLRAHSAVSVHGRFDLAGITVSRIAAEAHTWGMDSVAAEAVASETVEAILDSVDDSVVNPDLASAISRRAQSMLEG